MTVAGFHLYKLCLRSALKSSNTMVPAPMPKPKPGRRVRPRARPAETWRRGGERRAPTGSPETAGARHPRSAPDSPPPFRDPGRHPPADAAPGRRARSSRSDRSGLSSGLWTRPVQTRLPGFWAPLPEVPHAASGGSVSAVHPCPAPSARQWAWSVGFLLWWA